MIGSKKKKSTQSSKDTSSTRDSISQRTIDRKPAVSKSIKSGILFPVGRIHRLLKNRVGKDIRVGGTSAVYIGAILEYLCAEIVELSGRASRECREKRITPRHIQLAIKGDEELDLMIKATIAGGGVIPHIHRFLLQESENQGKNITNCI